MATSLEKVFTKDREARDRARAKELLTALVQPSQYVGEVFSISYETALVQIHDFDRKGVGGIPSLSFLIATRIKPGEEVDYRREDSSIILLRVMDAAPLPNAQEAERIRVEVAQRVSGDREVHWDDQAAMDDLTNEVLSFAGVKCRVIGTFYVDSPSSEPEADAALVLRFGSDLSNYYPNQGLKVYKPNGAALASIVNFRDPDERDPRARVAVPVGVMRYASTNRRFQGVEDVTVRISPTDLLAQKTALFGMTRKGKSNTTKVVLKSVFDLRYETGERTLRVGQLVFDANGEYANENTQDGDAANPAAIKNLRVARKEADAGDVVTYGITKHPNDPGRQLMLLNFFLDENLQIGKEHIDGVLAFQTSTYFKNFTQVRFGAEPRPTDFPTTKAGASEYYSARTRHDRRVLCYRALLVKAGFAPPKSLRAEPAGLFGEDIRDALRASQGDRAVEHKTAAALFEQKALEWDEMARACQALASYIEDPGSGYNAFEDSYIADHKKAWADEDLKKILTMFSYPNGSRVIGDARPYHTPQTGGDYAEAIYKDLVAGRLVIVDQSSGDLEINRTNANRVMEEIFRQNQEVFRSGKQPPEMLVYIEEAHSILPSDSEKDFRNIWVKTAKEGGKFRIGLVYATQEVSTIQRNILKNTANFFIAHLNNTDETRELCKYYDFADFESSIRRAQDKGFLRVKTLSNLFVVPVQIHRFRI